MLFDQAYEHNLASLCHYLDGFLDLLPVLMLCLAHEGINCIIVELRARDVFAQAAPLIRECDMPSYMLMEMSYLPIHHYSPSSMSFATNSGLSTENLAHHCNIP